MSVTRVLFALTAAAGISGAALGQSWGTSFVNQTSQRLVLSPTLQILNLEKDFGWGDFDQDGDIDVAMVIKFPGSIQGGFPNALLMNENGVLVDRTLEFASASDVPGDGGFFAPTNDRDVKAVDVDGDGWLDLVTTTTMSDQVDWILGQPRVYMNLGNDAQGNWQGFRFEKDRIPQLFAKNGSVANPRFCDMAIADLNGDGFPDIFMADYDTPETSGTICIDLNGDGDTNDPGECQQSPAETSSKDFDNKLLMNWGNTPGGPGPGYFFDSTTTRMTASQLASAFGNAAAIADFNQDGAPDVVRINTLTGGQNVGIIYGKPDDLGNSYTGPVNIYLNAPYNLAVGDLNNDGRLDLVIIDDSKDRFMINNGNGANGQATWTTFTINDSLTEFGNSAHLADLDNDGLLDLLVADVDADLPSFCPTTGRRAHIYKNTGVVGNNMLDEIGQIIPNGNLAATFDFAPIDINGDGWTDIVVGRCAGVEIWMNNPPIGLAFSYPSTPPATVTAGVETSLDVTINVVGGGPIVAGTAKLNYRIDGGAWQQSNLAGGPSLFTATLPALDCGQKLDYYFSAQLTSNGLTYTDPPAAPSSFFTSIPVLGEELVYETEFENGPEGWTVDNSFLTNAQGAWTLADPVGTFLTGGIPMSPENDNTPAPGVNAWITGLGAVGGSAASQDLDGGPIYLYSPVFNRPESSAVTISYAAWVACNDWPNTPAEADAMRVEYSVNGGQSWQAVRTIWTTNAAWQTFEDTVILSGSSVQFRFQVSDPGNNSTSEMGVDSVRLNGSFCQSKTPCPGDLDGSGAVDAADLAVLLGAWGSSGAADLDGSGSVDAADLALLLGGWGACK